jgi:inorganic pyrophosphatase
LLAVKEFKRLKENETKLLMTNYLELPIGPKAPDLINAVIEIPLEGISKYEYDKELHVFRLDRNLFSPVHYPGDYGFIPSTLGDDGDPLDVLVLVDTPSFPGCVQEVRPIGVLDMIDQGQGDEKILAVGEGNPRYNDITEYSQVYPHILKEITHFFSIYKDLEGKAVEVRGWKDASTARAIILKAQKAFDEKKAKG